jgi:HIT zinc finger
MSTKAHRENADSSAATPPRALCQGCHREPSLYKCPRCHFMSCSLACCVHHKRDRKCNGKRDATSFVSVSHMTDAHAKSDYFFLENVLNTVDASQRRFRQLGPSYTSGGNNNTNKRPRTGDAAPDGTTEEAPLHPVLLASRQEDGKRTILPELLQQPRTVPPARRQLMNAALERSVRMLLLPAGMERHKTNKSRLNHRKELQWTVEWVLHTSPKDSNPQTKISVVSETAVVWGSLQSLLLVDDSTNTTNNNASSAKDNVSIFIKKLPCPSNRPLYFEIARHQTLRDALVDRTVYEYPTLYVVVGNITNSNTTTNSSHQLLRAQFPLVLQPVVQEEVEDGCIVEEGQETCSPC